MFPSAYQKVEIAVVCFLVVLTVQQTVFAQTARFSNPLPGSTTATAWQNVTGNMTISGQLKIDLSGKSGTAGRDAIDSLVSSDAGNDRMSIICERVGGNPCLGVQIWNKNSNTWGDIAATKFTDIDNQSYYLDPSSVVTSGVLAGPVVIGNTSPNPSAILDLTSTTQGFLPPRLTTAQRNGIGSPAAGLTIFNTDTSNLEFWDGSCWQSGSGGASTCSSSAKRVFVTSTGYTGDLKTAGSGVGLGAAVDGLDGADKICQSRANAVNLGGTWKAWLSSSTVSAASRVTHTTGPYILINGPTVANNWAGLTSGTLLHNLDNSENNSTVNGAVWTNTNPDGTIYATLSSSACNDWTSNVDNPPYWSNIGDQTSLNSRWTTTGNNGCGGSGGQFHIYCFEQ